MSTETSRCEVCSKTFENFRALKIHQQKVHGTFQLFKLDLSAMWKFQYSLSIQRCSAVARRTQINVRFFTGKKIFQCKLCPMVFTRNDSLLIHVHRHNNINPYKCQICKETFLLRAERDKHRTKEHSAEMSLGCPKCSRKFFDTKALRIHLFKTHSIKITATVFDDKREEHTAETNTDEKKHDIKVEEQVRDTQFQE